MNDERELDAAERQDFRDGLAILLSMCIAFVIGLIVGRCDLFI